MYSIIIVLNMWNLLNAMRFFRIVNWIILIIEKTFVVVVQFLFILFPIMFAFAFFSLT